MNKKNKIKKISIKSKSIELNNKGVDLQMEGKVNEALECYINSIKADRKNFRAWTNKGLIYYTRQEHDKAIEAFDQALKIQPNYELALLHKALCLSVERRYEESLIFFNKTLELNPNNIQANIGISWVKKNLSQGGRGSKRKEKKTGKGSKKLAGLAFYITGKLKTMTIIEANNMVMEHGGAPLRGVVKHLSYLVTNSEEKTSEIIKAEEQGIKIISEEEFLAMIDK